METVRRVVAQIVTGRTLKYLATAAVLYWVPVLILARISEEIVDRDPIHLDINFLSWLHTFSTPALDRHARHQPGRLSGHNAGAIIGLMVLIRRQPADATILLVGVGGAAARSCPKSWFHDRGLHSAGDRARLFVSQRLRYASRHSVSALVLLWNSKTLAGRRIAVAYVPLLAYHGCIGVHFPRI
jgi:hypothetical protein